MGLEIIHIKNYKSIKDYKINLKQMNLLLGENGSGKTNVLSAIIYFYENMISQNPSLEIFDQNNYLNDQVEITLTYNLGKSLMRSRQNKNAGKIRFIKYYNMIESMSENGRISLTLSQVKGGRVTWNHGIDKRKILYHMYPLYKLDAREINLVDWEELWKNIGDLIKPSSKTRDAIHNNVVDVVKEREYQIENRFEMLEDIFTALNISPIKFSVSEFSANLTKMYYNGSEFAYIGHKLDNLSNGTNSYNYICLMLYVLSAMGRLKMKEPVFLMDEPEISLHFHMIDELSDVLFECVEDMIVLAATHSPRFVRNILVKEKNNCTIYQVYKRREYSQLCLLSMFTKEEKREKYFLTEHHANAFFAKLLILVEGETELELLQNFYLRMLFPILKEAEIIKGMSDKVIYRIIDTTTRHYNVPMVALLDMDKILEWDVKNNQMIWKKEYQYVSEREKYYYGDKRNNTVSRKKRIRVMCNKCRFSYRLPFFSSVDKNYSDLIKVIQEYYQKYNIFPVRTTIEGVLINENNYTKIVEYLTDIGKWHAVEKAYQLLYNENDKVNFLRLLFHGKSDFLLKTKVIIKENKKLYKELKNVLEKCAIGKTDWVSDWIRYYFANIRKMPKEKMTQMKFAELCKNPTSRRNLTERFSGDFTELFQFIDSVTKLFNSDL